MKILIIGGTQFIGRPQVETALAHGHEVTLFNRGKTNPELFPEVEKLVGDRDGQLDALKHRRWDAVIDNCGYLPRIVSQSVRLLADTVERYVFISTIAVYADMNQPDIDENSPLTVLPSNSPEAVTNETYGAYKVLCEKVVQETLADRALIIRPGLIVGPYDPTYRFTYWVSRIADSARPEVLAPDSPQCGTQFIDVRDLGQWTIRMAEAHAAGIYNATGPDYPLTLGKVFDTSCKAAGTTPYFTWVSESFLNENGVRPFSDLPLWLPRAAAGFEKVKMNKATAAGLTFRPLDKTVRDTLAWERERRRTAPDPDPMLDRAGLKPERESELLAAWHARQQP